MKTGTEHGGSQVGDNHLLFLGVVIDLTGMHGFTDFECGTETVDHGAGVYGFMHLDARLHGAPDTFAFLLQFLFYGFDGLFAARSLALRRLATA